MIRCYALTFAAVTLRLWLPLAQFVLHIEFIPAYQAISWLCWVPNLLVAEMIVRSSAKSIGYSASVSQDFYAYLQPHIRLQTLTNDYKRQ